MRPAKVGVGSVGVCGAARERKRKNGLRGDVRALMVKDVRMFWRDTTQWGQSLVLFGLLGGLVTFWFSPIGNWVSRKHEYEADAFARDAMAGPAPLIGALRKLSQKKRELEEQWRSDESEEQPEIGEDEIADVVSMWTGIPVTRIASEESQRLLEQQAGPTLRLLGCLIDHGGDFEIRIDRLGHPRQLPAPVELGDEPVQITEHV